MATVQTPSRGEIWLVNFDPSVAGEIRKIRPAIVMSIDSIGKLPLRMVVPVTDWHPRYAAFPWFVELNANASNGLVKDSGADTFQTKSISLKRFVRRIGSITTVETDAVASAVALCVGAP